MVDGEQIDRPNAAKRARAVRVVLDVACRCSLHEGTVERKELTLSDVVGIVGHSSDQPPLARTASSRCKPRKPWRIVQLWLAAKSGRSSHEKRRMNGWFAVTLHS
jgi:hypothetical protein